VFRPEFFFQKLTDADADADANANADADALPIVRMCILSAHLKWRLALHLSREVVRIRRACRVSTRAAILIQAFRGTTPDCWDFCTSVCRNV
jgi:hypothetical protein